MKWSIPNFTSELKYSENNLLQVLLSEFDLHRIDNRIRLDIEIDPAMPTIRRREAKQLVQEMIRDFKAKSSKYQADIEDFTLRGMKDRLQFRDKNFAFRYASGGVLPILILNGTEYYCLFYRDIFPVGWNIANGGCDSLAELLDPTITALRELQEELIIFDFTEGHCVEYYYSYPNSQPFELIEFETARRLWQAKLNDRVFAYCEKERADLTWLRAPDSIRVKIKGFDTCTIRDCIVNINASDFGIEIDKIARIKLKGDITLLDGELINGKLLGQAIGLFEVDKLNKKITNGNEFLPDRLFYDGTEMQPRDLEQVVETYWNRLVDQSVRSKKEKHQWFNKRNTPAPFDLCPVTRSVINRYKSGLQKHETNFKPMNFDVFLSHSHVDIATVRHIRDELVRNGISCWLDEENIGGNERVVACIEEGLLHSKLMLVCLSDTYAQSEWCKLEYRTFLHNFYGELDTDKILLLKLGDKIGIPPLLRDIQHFSFKNNVLPKKLAETIKRLSH